ncbi:GntR family transcriptional regulator [Saccharopolyspora spinosa]|uniref:GntR family transcriptional regulator n=1 Tax=Saccharopolyspora spinosa TaxID=60894 RepID=A0A2N3Y6F8_SACSN|nr:GntR family transcriptional regulator [Saccharopolyspora spinosa]PKW18500.1 GntR family transcriptional regulator [Saccharopolyspora spinosa]
MEPNQPRTAGTLNMVELHHRPAAADSAVGSGNGMLAPLDARVDNLTDRVFEAIRDSIVSQALPPGRRVSEAKLAAELNVSKTPVREALLRLRHVGLVEAAPKGLRVISASVRAIRDAYEHRAGLESSAAWFTAHRATSAQRERLHEVATSSLRAAESGDSAQFRAEDRVFHHIIAEFCGNEILQRAVDNALVLTAVLRERDTPSTGDSISCASEHIATASAVLAGDADRAARNNADHILHVMSLVLSSHTQRGNVPPGTS